MGLAELRGVTVKDELDLQWALAVAAKAIFEGAKLDDVVDQLNVILDPKSGFQGIEIREDLVRMLKEREDRL